ncbi:MAG TPA: TlpA disulfide reductase family protein [Vicinamibacterales bacterium]|nr:TlpA disulfide reductase family protein [Vicinamibacterales bacterium]
MRPAGLVATVVAAMSLASPEPQTVTPQSCVQSARAEAVARQRQTQPMTAAILRQIEADRIASVRKCAAAFDLDKTAPQDLAGLADLYAEAMQPDLAERAIARGMQPGLLDTESQAALLGTGIRNLLRQPKSPERNAKAEAYMTRLDSLPEAALDQQLAAHLALNGYYRGDDIDAGIIRHSTWLIDIAPKLNADRRRRFGFQILGAYENLAEVLAGQGEHQRAVELLQRAPRELSDVPGAERRVAQSLERYLLVGKPAAAISAPVWLNTPPGTTALEMKGSVTLLQFTAHWCGPCRESYAGIQRLRQRFANRPFRVVFATELYGYFEGERNLPAAEEVARDRTYFAGLGLDVPVAIGRNGESTVDGRPVYTPDPNTLAYAVSGIPQINVIDREGTLRLIMIGYDDANEERLASFIETLLR